ncbi:MAG: DegQ family serine endoprotease [Phycisphaerae bacterium]|nr:DegQ family serine endoprotease [Phycisphaerae bacterium]
MLSIALIVWTAAPAVADDGIATLRETSKAFSEVAKKAIPAVVSIRVEKTVSQPGQPGRPGQPSPFDDEFFERFFGPRYRQPAPRPRPQVGQGSGFIISPDGYILTNNHVVGDADKIVVTLQDGKEYDSAKVIGTDPKSDVALIKIEGEGLPAIELGDSDALDIGEWVIAVGSPFGLQATVTVGVVSAKSRGVGITEYEDFIQTDAAINPGNSGGPLLNIDGKAVGINTAIFSQSGGYMGIGFAIPINMAKSIEDQLKATGKVTRGYIGIVMHPEKISPELADVFGLKDNKGVLITEVVPESPADKAGLERRDIIRKINGKVVEDWQSFRNEVALLKPGTKINLTVLRDGKEKAFTVEIGSLEEGEMAMLGSSEAAKTLGVQVQELTEEIARRLGFGKARGVIVTEVSQGSPADRAGITPGILIVSVNRRDIATVKEFSEAVEESAKTGKVLLLVRNERYAQYVVVNLK